LNRGAHWIMVKTPIYMDNNATTRTDPRVVNAMLPYFTEKFGNAASRNHSFGWEAEEAVDNAREQVGTPHRCGAPRRSCLRAAPPRATTSPSRAWASMYRKKGDHIITAVTEHKAVLDPCKRSRTGRVQGDLPAGGQGRPSFGRAGSRRPDRQDDTRQHHGGQQRDRHCAADRRDRQAVQAAWHTLPHGRRTGGRQGAGGRRGDGHRPAQPVGPQDLRTQGHRRAVRPTQGSACPPRPAD